MTKKLTLVVILYSIFNLFVEADAQNLRFGVQAGVGGASAYNYFPERNEFTTDFELGIPKNYSVFSYQVNLYLSYPINEEFGVAVEPGYIQKGFANKFTENNDLIHNKYFLSYIHLPVLLEYNLEIPLTVTIGPEFGYLLRAKMTNDGIEDAIDLMNYYQKNRLDIGLQFGGYYTFSERLDVGLKVGGSFTNLEKFYFTDDLGNVVFEVSKKAVYTNAFVRMRF